MNDEQLITLLTDFIIDGNKYYELIFKVGKLSNLQIYETIISALINSYTPDYIYGGDILGLIGVLDEYTNLSDLILIKLGVNNKIIPLISAVTELITIDESLLEEVENILG